MAGSGTYVNHSFGLAGLMALKPPSPALTLSQLVPLAPECESSTAGEPLS